jgi:competence protein ComEA
MTRTGWLGALALVALGLGVAARLSWPSPRPSLDCEPERVRWVDSGAGPVATCAPAGFEVPSAERPAGPSLVLGVRLDLNRASEDELRLVPGIGPKLARALVEARAARGGFRDWDEVDAVPGMGPAKLARLKEAADLRP